MAIYNGGLSIKNVSIGADTGLGNAITSLSADGNVITPNRGSTFLTKHQDISGKEDKSNKVTAWSSTTTDTNYPSERLVKAALDNVLKENTELLSAQLTSGTKTISNILNYRLIGIYVFNGSGQYLSGATCATPWHLINYCNDSNHRLVLSTDTLYYALYFPSATSIAVHNYYVGTGNTPTIKVVGIW